MDAKRQLELHRNLVEQRRTVADGLKEKMRANRDENAQRRGDRVRDFAEDSEVSMREDVGLALLQMKIETLNKIDQALGRLSQNAYGYCFDCGGEISEQRLRAEPFAIRCKDCEEARENAEQEERRRHPSVSTFSDRGPAFDSR